ncbi:putative iron-only hydrogenase system regulator [Alkalispirochaeta americana]|uniref:Putative iron-only hydrogenase system regulator n=1 Tax=Alkalispirochaeta americana TaxID=159291 RepID=A0A1N6PUH7_9SPIO|nr:TM1266 family iron-only hydrogenase system putative regulator [Alkalispirochaeta americana]SIQ07956.1 putative iron-only hydrogenase system regulator [Alkalispirochaeta americana]
METRAEQNKRYGFVGIIVENRHRLGARINQILSAHADCIVGRLGLPNLEEGSISIITLIVRATTDEMGSLSGKLGALPGVTVKTGLQSLPGTALTEETP